MKDKEIGSLLAVGSLVLLNAKKNKVGVASSTRPKHHQVGARPPAGVAGTTGWESANYTAGLIVGAGSVAFLWWAWTKARPRVRKFATVTQ